MANKTYRIAMARHLSTKAAVAYDIVCHPDRFPEFMPNVESVRIVESGPTRKVAEWAIVIDEAPLEWREEGTYDHAAHRVTFRALDGVFDRFDGFWEVVDEADGCRVAFELEYEVGLPEIEEIVGPMLEDKLIENANGMLCAIEKRADT